MHLFTGREHDYSFVRLMSKPDLLIETNSDRMSLLSNTIATSISRIWSPTMKNLPIGWQQNPLTSSRWWVFQYYPRFKMFNRELISLCSSKQLWGNARITLSTHLKETLNYLHTSFSFTQVHHISRSVTWMRLMYRILSEFPASSSGHPRSRRRPLSLTLGVVTALTLILYQLKAASQV